jgi:outer membrane protein
MKLKILVLVLAFPSLIHGQQILDEYVHEGLQNNLALKQKESSYEKSLEALNEAHGLFYPDISLNARYSVSRGGRVIDFPIGDLLNPVYSTLNQLTSSGNFPMVENEQINFLRPTEHETKIRLIQPVFNPDIYFNTLIKKELTVLEEADMKQYKSELVTEIKKAYYDVAMSGLILSMLGNTKELLIENIRVNKKLVENDKITIDNLYRSETELSKFEQVIQNALKNKKIASAYFNFLLNKSLTDSILVEEPTNFPVLTEMTPNLAQSAINNREEMKKLENYYNISEFQLQMNQSGKLPDLTFIADYGFQGEQYRVNKEQDYLQASAVLTWNLFAGFRNKSKIEQSLLQKEILGNQIEEAKKQIELQVINSLNELLAAEKGIVAAESQVQSAREGFRLVNRKYEEGQASLIEYIDARTSMTMAEENLIISRFTYLSDYAEFEKISAIIKPE